MRGCHRSMAHCHPPLQAAHKHECAHTQHACTHVHMHTMQLAASWQRAATASESKEKSWCYSHRPCPSRPANATRHGYTPSYGPCSGPHTIPARAQRSLCAWLPLRTARALRPCAPQAVCHACTYGYHCICASACLRACMCACMHVYAHMCVRACGSQAPPPSHPQCAGYSCSSVPPSPVHVCVCMCAWVLVCARACMFLYACM